MSPANPQAESSWRHQWQGGSVGVSLIVNGGRLQLDEWAKYRPAAARVAEWLGMAPDTTELLLSPQALSSLSDYDANQLGLPLHMDVWVRLRTEGRIDSSRFLCSLTLEPMQYSHPWAVYRRDGAMIFVGDRAYRLNAAQLEVMELYDALVVAGDDVARRLALLPRLVEAQHAPRSARLRVTGYLGNAVLHRLEEAGDRLLLTRRNGRVVPFAAAPETGWAMSAKHHYYLRSD